MTQQKSGITIEAQPTAVVSGVTESPSNIDNVAENAAGATVNLAETAARGPQEGATDANKYAANIMEMSQRVLVNSTHAVAYYLSFGTVFSFLAVKNMIPVDSTIDRAVRDGAEAAQAKFDAWQAREIPTVKWNRQFSGGLYP
jgi:hypothetical protein